VVVLWFIVAQYEIDILIEFLDLCFKLFRIAFYRFYMTCRCRCGIFQVFESRFQIPDILFDGSDGVQVYYFVQ
jgi:hypothetical protein